MGREIRRKGSEGKLRNKVLKPVLESTFGNKLSKRTEFTVKATGLRW